MDSPSVGAKTLPAAAPRSGEEDHCRQPIERHDACDATAEESRRSARTREQLPGREHHHEAGDDEEQIDACGPGQGSEAVEARADFRGRMSGVVLGVVKDHHASGDRPENLACDELLHAALRDGAANQIAINGALPGVVERFTNARENRAEHVRRQYARVRIVAGAMIAVEKRQTLL